MRMFRGSRPAPEQMVVERVWSDDGMMSRIEPPYDRSWSDFDKLRWDAAVCAIDSGLQVRVVPSICLGYGPRARYDVQCGSSSLGPLLPETASDVLTGISIGAQQMAAQLA